MTNAEKIRSMTDEELGRYLCDMQESCDGCPTAEECFLGSNGMLSWLKQEVDE